MAGTLTRFAKIRSKLDNRCGLPEYFESWRDPWGNLGELRFSRHAMGCCFPALSPQIEGDIRLAASSIFLLQLAGGWLILS